MVGAISACNSRDMHSGRKRATRFRRGHFLANLSVFALCAASLNGGCAAEVNTLEPLDESGAGETNVDMPGAAGTKTTSGGQASSGGSPGGNAGSKMVSAFGGTSSSGGKGGAGGSSNSGSSGGAGGSGGANSGGAGANSGGAGGSGGANSGGAKNGGAGGQGGTGGNAQAGTASGGMAGTGGGLACLAKWKGDVCDTCSKQTQSDKLACVDILNCYAANSCGPATCGGNTDKCGANNIGKGTAGYPIAQDVYSCLCK
jgi:hypothetical protein